MKFFAPAKINLSLEITRRREDGFHELETLVLPLPGLADELNITPSDQFSLHCETPGVPTDESNLVSKALRIFEREANISCPFQIELTKHVPHGAGLGGGSSDSATTLLALNQLTEANIPVDTLAAWASELGSDVPLFLYQAPCQCSGRGEIITPTSVDWPYTLVLFKPAFDIPTPWAYSRWRDSQELPDIDYSEQVLGELGLKNDLERPVFEKHLFLAHLKTFLQAQNSTCGAMMSGSGSTVFAILENEADAEDLVTRTLAEMDPTMWHHVEAPTSQQNR